MNFYDILLAKKLSGGGGGDITTEALNVTANGQYTAPQGKAYTPVNVDIKGYKVGEVVVPTDIASFTASDAPLKSLTASIEPQQDLHGYDSPWAGGAGKNKLPLVLADIKALNTSGSWSGNNYTINGVTFTIDTDDDGNIISIKTNGTASANANLNLNKIPPLPNTSLIISGCPSGGTSDTYGLRYSNYADTSVWDTGSGKTFTPFNYTTYPYSGTDIAIYSGVNASNKIWYPMIRLSTESDATFAPYSNICPISGWTECEVVDDAVYGGFIDWNQLINVSGFPSGELYGITYVNNDSSFTINGTATAAVYLNIVPNFQNLLNNNHIYLFCPNISDTSQPIAMTDSYNGQIQIKNSAIVKKSSWNTFWLAYYIPNGSTITNVVITPQVYDLTQLFGSTKADEIYAMEQAEAGSGVAYFKSLFYKDYYPYNSGEITNVSAVNGDTDKYRKYTIPFTDGQGQSVEVFGGECDVVNGVVTPCPYYASYNGEQLTGEWISDRDVYAEGTTPTIGAQVVNIGATGTPFSVQPTSIKSNDGENNVSASTGQIENLEYFEEL
jgi:hypothetical protein